LLLDLAFIRVSLPLSSGHRAIDPAEAFRLVTPDFELCILPESSLNDESPDESFDRATTRRGFRDAY